MKISVVVASRNAAATISECLESIERQVLSPHEVIVVDDGSSDNTADRARATGVPSSLIEVDFRNAAASRNAGIRLANGDWIAFLDADDTWYPEHLETAGTILARGTHVAYLSAADYVFASGGSPRSNPSPVCEGPSMGFDHTGFVAWFRRWSWFCNCTVLLRRDRVQEVGGFDESLPRRHDLDLFLRAIHGRTGAYSPLKSARIRLGVPGSISEDHLNCDMYLLKSLVQLLPLYGGEDFLAILRGRACAALNAALEQGSESDVRQAWALGAGHIGMRKRAFYRFMRGRPRLFRLLRAWRNA